MIIALTFLNAVMMTTGQLLWKAGMSGRQLKGVSDMVQALLSPYILAGLMIYGMSTVLWLYILNKADLSYAYPIQSVVYVFALFGSMFIFQEQVSLNRWIGVAVVCLGVYIISLK